MAKDKNKEIKTNAMRLLDGAGIAYRVVQYECDEFKDGVSVAHQTGIPEEQSFKTLVTKGRSGAYYVFVIPVAAELNLKAAAASVSEKSIEMLHVKDINKVTGYVRGGCSPLGMKKAYPTVIDETVILYDEIAVSGGRIGSTILLNPEDLIRVTGAQVKEITAAG